MTTSDSSQETALSCRPQFNAKSAHSFEFEGKDLVHDGDRVVFTKIEEYFDTMGWIHSRAKGKHLLTLQLDTPRRDMYKRGDTIRVRGECLNNDLNQLLRTDICVKTGKSIESSGALLRREYEAPHDITLKAISFDSLRKAYARAENPELHAVLDSVKEMHLMQHFRIDCIRHRFLIELPKNATGLKDKKVFGELLLDDVCFVLDLPALPTPLIFHSDLEVERELMFKPCSYDNNASAGRYVSSPLTQEEANIAMSAFSKHLRAAVPGKLVSNNDSKAERGFKALDQTLSALQEHLLPKKKNPKRERERKFIQAFDLNAGHSAGELPLAFGRELPHRAIASRKPVSFLPETRPTGR